MNKFFDYLFHKPNKLLSIIWRKVGFLVPDEPYLKVQFRLLMGKRLDLKNPQTFSEKLQWLKLYNRQPEYTTMVDKYAVKDYVAKILGEEYIIPTLGVWDKLEDIDWDSLPNQFVLKCTHDSGGLVICRDKSKLDKKAAIKKLSKTLKQNYYRKWREWPYKNVPRRIIAEKYVESDSNLKDLYDYKFFCFSGKMIFFKIDFNRQVDHHANYYSRDCELLPFGEANYMPKPEEKLTIPDRIYDMIALAEKLSNGIPFVRCDFYCVGKQIYFGEMTFFPATGMGKIEPEEWDCKIGQLIQLPQS